jgi:hypothetical protein
MLVLRIAESRQFSKSARLRDFLLYVCRASLDSHPDEINEQKIGERVFHRSPHYNANEDNIVRSHARLLRLKLDAYFAAEGADEPVILRIPKGGYIPEFVERPPALVEEVKTVIVEPLPAPPAAFQPYRLIMGLEAAVGLLSITILVLAWALVHRNSSTAAPAPAIEALWSQLFSDKMTTTIVVPDHTFAMMEEASGQHPNLQDYLHRYRPEDSAGTQKLLSLFPRFDSRRYTTFDAVATGVRILQLAEQFPSHVVVRYARDMTLRDLSPGNVILIGRPFTNLWNELFESKLNFRLYSDLPNHRVICKNTAPEPGEQAEYVPTLIGGRFEAYSSIAFLGNLNGGNVLIIGGAASSAQEGAGDFATSEKLLARLVDKIGREKGRLPYFDALLRTTTIDGMSQEPSVIAYRRLTGSR